MKNVSSIAISIQFHNICSPLTLKNLLKTFFRHFTQEKAMYWTTAIYKLYKLQRGSNKN